MRPSASTAVVRAISGLPDVEVLRVPARTDRVDELVLALERSAVLPGLVRLTARCAGVAAAQLSLLAQEQTASVEPGACTAVGPLEDSLCTVAVLSGDVLVVGDAEVHPWLHDLPPVRSGAVRAYLGVPLRLHDGTPVGALCAYDPEPREWGQEEVTLVCDLADLVALELQRLADA